MKTRNELVIVDTCIWIDFFKGHKNSDRLVELLEEDSVVTTGLIIAELIQGIKNKKEEETVLELISSLNKIEITNNIWIKAGFLCQELRKKGKTVPLSDAAIACLCIENKCRIFSNDKHFKYFTGLCFL